MFDKFNPSYVAIDTRDRQGICGWCDARFEYEGNHSVVCQAFDLPLLCEYCFGDLMLRAGMDCLIEPSEDGGPFLDIVLERHYEDASHSRTRYKDPHALQRRLLKDLLDARMLDMGSGENKYVHHWIRYKEIEFNGDEFWGIGNRSTEPPKPMPPKRTRVQILQDRSVQLAKDFDAGRIDLDTYCKRLAEL